MNLLPVTAVLITREDRWPDDVALDFPFAQTILETRCPGVHRRYELALEAQHDIIYVQDDDCLVDIHRLWSLFTRTRSRLYPAGLLTNNVTRYHLEAYRGSGTTLVGWGAFFPKRLIDFSRWDRCYGPGTMPSHEADRVFTYLAQPHATHVVPIREVRRESAMSRDNPDHYASRQRIWEALAEMSRRERASCVSEEGEEGYGHAV